MRANQPAIAGSSATDGATHRQRRAVALAPARDVHLEQLLAFLQAHRPVVVGRPGGARDRRVQDQRADALGVLGRQLASDGAAERVGEQRRAFAARGVEHGERVRDVLLERVAVAQAVGETGAAPVEQDQAVEDREALEEAAHRRRLPQLLDLRDPSGQEQQVEAALAGDLVGDARIAAAGIAGRGHHQSSSISERKADAGSTDAPAARARSASQRSEVTTRTAPGSGSASSRRTISSSAESRRGRGAWATSMTVERIGGRRRLLEHHGHVASRRGGPALEHVDEPHHRAVAVVPPLVRARADHVHPVHDPSHGSAEPNPPGACERL